MARNRCGAVAAIAAWIVLTIILLCPSWAAAIGFQPVSQDELKMTAEPKVPGASAIILYRQVDRDDQRLRPHEDQYLRIKILKEEGRGQANVKIGFPRNFLDIVNIHGRTIHADGSIVNFEGKVFEQVVYKAKGSSYLAKTFTLPDVQVGSVIEYYYTIDFADQYVYDSHWTVTADLFTKRARFTLKPFSSYYPEFTIRWSWERVASAPKMIAANLVALDLQDIPGLEAEEFMPPEDQIRSHVDFIYSRDQVQETVPAHYWKKSSKDDNGTLESFVGNRGAMHSALSGIVSPSDSPEQKARKIYARVQQFRNLDYEPHRTEQEKERNKEKAARDLTSVADVWKASVVSTN